MKDDARKQLKRILGAYDERLAETERAEAASRAAKEAFPERFSTLKKETILPALQELAEILNRSGHEARASELEESSTTAGGVSSAAVGLRIIPKSFAQRASDTKRSYIEILFSAYRSDRKIVVSSTNTLISSGGGVGKRGEYEIEALTGDVVVAQVLQTLEEALGGK